MVIITSIRLVILCLSYEHLFNDIVYNIFRKALQESNETACIKRLFFPELL